MANAEESENGAPRSNHPPSIGKRVQDIESSAQHLMEEAKGVVTDLRDTLDIRARVQRHPYAMLALAAGVGYVLGGGLFTRLTGSLVRLGVRLAAVPLVKDELMNLAQGALSGLGSEQSSEQPQSTGTGT